MAANTFTRAGFTFAGWNDGTNPYAAGATYTMGTSDVTLTAQWTAIPTHTVTYASGGGTGTPPTQADVAEGASFIVAANTFTRAGFTFAGWNDGTNPYAAGATYTMGTSNVTLTAQWTANSTLVCENFDAFTPGSRIGTYTGWFDGGNGPLVTSGIGVASSVGLDDANNIFTWTAHPFDWTAPDFVGVNLQADFQTDGSGHFDDDRVGWMITDTSAGSDNIFGVQMDPGGTGASGYNIEAYWDGNTFGDNGGRTSIANLPTLSANAWYRLRAEITKLSATSAMINVTLTALDASGNPGAVVASGSIPDTALLPNTTGNEIPNPAYFTGPIWPAYKNYTTAGASADNTCYEVVTGSPPPQYTLTVNITGNGSVTLNPAGGTYYEGTPVQLTANPDPGYAFSGWTGDLISITNPEIHHHGFQQDCHRHIHREQRSYRNLPEWC